MFSPSEAERNLSFGHTSGESPLPRVTLQEGSPSISPMELEHEQSDMCSTASSGKLSRRTTFAPGVVDSMNRAEGVISPVQQSDSRQSSIIKQSSIMKQVSVSKQPSVTKQGSIIKQGSVVKQSSVSRQSSIVRQPSNVRLRSITPSRGQPFAKLQLSLPSERSLPKTQNTLTSKQSIDSPRSPKKSSSSSLHTAKTVKIEDVLDDYKVVA